MGIMWVGGSNVSVTFFSGALGQRMEKVLKAHVDAMWAWLAEESAKREKLERERVQQVTTILTSFMSKDMPVALEQGFKKEFAAIGPVVAQAILPPLQNVVVTTVFESFHVSFSLGLTSFMFDLWSWWIVLWVSWTLWAPVFGKFPLFLLRPLC